MKHTLLMKGCKGLGDNIYMRAVVRAIAKRIYIETPWPELYAGLSDVFPVKPASCGLRTQRAHMDTTPFNWPRMPPGTHNAGRVLVYGTREIARYGSLLGALEAAGHTKVRRFDLPKVPRIIEEPYVLVRPPTLRREWFNPARNPEPGAMDLVLAAIPQRKIAVANLHPAEEWLAEDVAADEKHYAGEFGLVQLMSLVAHADLVVAPVGWVVPMALAYQTPLFVLFGGMGANNAPEHMVHPCMGTRPFGYTLPRAFCRCDDMTHACDKQLVDPVGDFERWRDGLPGGLRVAS